MKDKTAPTPPSGRPDGEIDRERLIQLLEICNRASGLPELTHDLTGFFREITGCEAIGVRLEQDGDFPYFETCGFPAEFVERERHLCERDTHGAIVRDFQGNPVLECMCGNVLRGRFDPAKPFFTARGSFWTSSTSQLLASTTEADRQARTRNRCNGEGYESVALIALRYQNKTFGLVQFNDRRPGRFSLTGIEFFESLIDYVAIAVSKRLDEMALRESEARYRALFSATSDAVVACRMTADGLPGPIFAANDSACKMLGYPPEGLIGVPYMQLRAPESDSNIPAIIKGLRQGRDALIRSVHLTRTGRRIPVEIHACLFDYHQEPSMMAVIRNVTDRIRDEEQRFREERERHQAERLEALEILAGGVAHDFNNLLMVIMGNTDIIEYQTPPDAMVHKNLQQITRAATRAADLCRQMLAYAGRGRLLIEQVFVSRLLEEMSPRLHTLAGKQAALHLFLASDLVPIEASADQIRQVIENLVVNSVEALGKDKGTISVSSGLVSCSRDDLDRFVLGTGLPAGDYVYFEVADTGCGMDTGTQTRIFSPFFSTKFLGRGLGLPAVHGIVRSHRGAIDIETTPGQGTRVRVMLPPTTLRAEGPEPRPVPAPEPTPASERLILLVDDDEQVRELGVDMLEEMQYRVITECDGAAALATFARLGPQIALVILDLTMPVMDGDEACTRLRRLSPTVPIIIATGHSEPQIRNRFAERQVEGFLQKPYTTEALRTLLDRVLPTDAATTSNKESRE